MGAFVSPLVLQKLSHITLRAVNLGVQPLLENAFADVLQKFRTAAVQLSELARATVQPLDGLACMSM